VSDSVVLSQKVDAMVLLVRSDLAKRPVLVETRRVLEACPTQKLGYVLTAADHERSGYGYGYGYAHQAHTDGTLDDFAEDKLGSAPRASRPADVRSP
jgi:hypothetical protein